ncbi:hypothetical protein BsWGS_08970 [Bradybaena similaris]
MFFKTVTEITNILFEGWNTHTWKDVCLSALLICALTIIFECLKAGKSYVKLRQHTRHSVAVEEDINNEFAIDSTSMHAELITAHSFSGFREIRRRKFFLYLLESLIHVFTIFFGYILMLLVMTYSVWYLVAIVVGSAIGFFISRPVIEHLTSKYSPPKDMQGDLQSGRVGRHHQDGRISTPGLHQGLVL